MAPRAQGILASVAKRQTNSQMDRCGRAQDDKSLVWKIGVLVKKEVAGRMPILMTIKDVCAHVDPERSTRVRSSRRLDASGTSRRSREDGYDGDKCAQYRCWASMSRTPWAYATVVFGCRYRRERGLSSSSPINLAASQASRTRSTGGFPGCAVGRIGRNWSWVNKENLRRGLTLGVSSLAQVSRASRLGVSARMTITPSPFQGVT